MKSVNKESAEPTKKPPAKEKPKPQPKPLFHCEFCGRDGHLEQFCWKKRREERRQFEFSNQDRYHSSHSVPGSGSRAPQGPVRSASSGFRGVPRPARGGFQDRSFDRPRREFGRRPPFGGQVGRGRSYGGRREYQPRFPPRGGRVRRESVPPMGRVDGSFANPSFEQMARHWFNSFCANPSVESFAHSRSRY